MSIERWLRSHLNVWPQIWLAGGESILLRCDDDTFRDFWHTLRRQWVPLSIENRAVSLGLCRKSMRPTPVIRDWSRHER